MILHATVAYTLHTVQTFETIFVFLSLGLYGMSHTDCTAETNLSRFTTISLFTIIASSHNKL